MDLEEEEDSLSLESEISTIPSDFEYKVEERKIKIFDTRLFRRIWPKCPGVLSHRIKRLLTLRGTERTDDDASQIINEMEGIRFFQRFSTAAKESLARKLIYATHERGTCLLREGQRHDPEQAMYVIISGVVAVKCPISHPDSGEKKYWQEKMLKRGKSFGYSDLIRDRLPSIDAETLGYCELLMLQRQDFNIIKDALSTFDARFEECLRSIKTLTAFNWTEDEYKALELYAQLVTFADNEEIFRGEQDKPSLNVFFVVDGECKIVRDLFYVIDSSPGYRHYRAIEPTDAHLEPANVKIHKKTLEFARLKRGNFFGVGESIKRDRILSVFSLECLLVPRFLLITKAGDLLSKMASSLTNSLPSDQDIVDNYRETMRWEKRKMEIMEEIFKEKPEMRVGHQTGDEKPRFQKYF